MKNSTVGTALILAATGVMPWPASSEEVTESPVMVVTASRTEQPIEDVSATVEVIDRQTIESFSGRSVAEVLQYAAGVEVADKGNETRIALRGLNTEHTLILVDGQRRTDKASGSFISNLQVEDIERIEIVRGPMSALYGSDALGGVINVITRKPQSGTQYGFDVTGGATEDGQRETSIVGGYSNWQTGKAGHRLSIEAKQRGDFRLDEEAVATDLRDEERLNAAYHGRYALSQTDALRWSAEFADQDDAGVALDRDGQPVDMIETEERYYLSAGYDATWGEGVVSLSLGRGVSDSTSDKGTGTLEETTSEKDEVQGQYTFWPAQAHAISIGYGFLDELFDSTVVGGAQERDVHSLFVQDQWRLAPRTELTVGVRHDDYSDFGTATTPRATLAWRPGRWTARVGYGEAFRAPSMIELYSEYTMARKTVIGNPDLDAETSHTTEAALAYRLASGQIELVAYRTAIEDLIQKYDVVKTLNPVTGAIVEWTQSYQNIAEADIRGAELTLSAQPRQGWHTTGSLVYLDAEDADTGEKLTGRADWTLKLSSSIDVGPATYHIRLRRVQDYLASGSAVEPDESDFTTVDLRLDYRLSKSHQVFFGVDNILDEEQPENMLWGGAPTDPGTRYLYAGYRGRF